jgi:ParB family protein of integrating conjugative element (PFGI_1 class)
MTNLPEKLITVPLKDLRPFDMNPRITRNPDYEKIKASIRLRGLEHPPHITQRPGELFYIISSGGNTRLAILNELWQETRDDRYRSVACIFRPWQPEKSVDEGNLCCLLGHLIENEMRGSLTFIERALGVCRARELYQRTSAVVLSQTQLAQRLRDDGFPVTQSDISKMESAVELLLPHIPDVLYGGLSRLGTEKILLLRSNAEQCWHQQSAGKAGLPFFSDIFALALSPFNGPLAGFSFDHLRDELTGLMSQALNTDYNTVALATDNRSQKRQQLLGIAEPTLPEVAQQRTCRPPSEEKPSRLPGDIRAETGQALRDPPDENPGPEEHEEQSVFTPPTEDSQSIRPQSGENISRDMAPDIIWTIDPLSDTPECLASVADQTAWEVAATVGLENLISPSEDNGFDITTPKETIPADARLIFQILSFLAGNMTGGAMVWHQLLTGSSTQPALLNDMTVIQLFRLIRTLRRLHEKQQEGVIS